MRARTLERIERDNLRRTRSHLQLARVRLSVGTAGQGEVYRWESELATGQKRAIDANSRRNLAEISLNRVTPASSVYSGSSSAMTRYGTHPNYVDWMQMSQRSVAP
jgi:outer membrane protein TolC